MPFQRFFLSCTIAFLLTFFTFLSKIRNILYNVSFFCNLYFFFVSILFALFKYAEHRAMPAFGKKNLFLLINNICCDILFSIAQHVFAAAILWRVPAYQRDAEGLRLLQPISQAKWTESITFQHTLFREP